MVWELVKGGVELGATELEDDWLFELKIVKVSLLEGGEDGSRELLELEDEIEVEVEVDEEVDVDVDVEVDADVNVDVDMEMDVDVEDEDELELKDVLWLLGP